MHFTLSEADYLAAQRLHLQRRPLAYRLVIWLVIAVGLGVAGLGLARGNHWLALAGLFYAGLPWLARRVMSEPLARRYFRRHPQLQRPQTLELHTAGLRLRAGEEQQELEWDDLRQWQADQHLALLYVQPRQYFIVPLSADPEGQLVAALQAHLPKAGQAGQAAA